MLIDVGFDSSYVFFFQITSLLVIDKEYFDLM